MVLLRMGCCEIATVPLPPEAQREDRRLIFWPNLLNWKVLASCLWSARSCTISANFLIPFYFSIFCYECCYGMPYKRAVMFLRERLVSDGIRTEWEAHREPSYRFFTNFRGVGVYVRASGDTVPQTCTPTLQRFVSNRSLP